MSLGRSSAFTLIELLVVIAIIAILAVVVVLTLNPAQLLAQSRDANRVSDMATLQSALNLYTTDQSGNLQLGGTASTSISVPDPNASTTCGSLGLPSLGASSTWGCSSASNYRLATSTGWIGVNFNLISSGSPFGSEPVDPVNQTSSGLFYAYNTNGSQFQVTATLESTKYKAQYGSNPQVSLFPEVISGGTPGVSALYNPTGLVGYWPLDEGNGSSTADQSGNNNGGIWHGTADGSNNTYYASGKVGTYAGYFDGTTNSAYVALTTSTPLQNPNVTIMAWGYTNDNKAIQFLGGDGDTGAANSGYWIGILSNQIKGYVGNGTTNHSVATTRAYLGSWVHIAMTYDGVTQSLYVNGALVATSTAVSGNIAYNGYTTYIGALQPLVTSRFWDGSIDDFRIYNRALSAAEIAAIYNAEK